MGSLSPSVSRTTPFLAVRFSRWVTAGRSGPAGRRSAFSRRRPAARPYRPPRNGRTPSGRRELFVLAKHRCGNAPYRPGSTMPSSRRHGRPEMAPDRTGLDAAAADCRMRSPRSASRDERGIGQQGGPGHVRAVLRMVEQAMSADPSHPGAGGGRLVREGQRHPGGEGRLHRVALGRAGEVPVALVPQVPAECPQRLFQHHLAVPVPVIAEREHQLLVVQGMGIIAQPRQRRMRRPPSEMPTRQVLEAQGQRLLQIRRTPPRPPRPRRRVGG